MLDRTDRNPSSPRYFDAYYRACIDIYKSISVILLPSPSFFHAERRRALIHRRGQMSPLVSKPDATGLLSAFSLVGQPRFFNAPSCLPACPPPFSRIGRNFFQPTSSSALLGRQRKTVSSFNPSEGSGDETRSGDERNS